MPKASLYQAEDAEKRWEYLGAPLPSSAPRGVPARQEGYMVPHFSVGVVHLEVPESWHR